MEAMRERERGREKRFPSCMPGENSSEGKFLNSTVETCSTELSRKSRRFAHEQGADDLAGEKFSRPRGRYARARPQNSPAKRDARAIAADRTTFPEGELLPSSSAPFHTIHAARA